jgi:hypothetical protein
LRFYDKYIDKVKTAVAGTKSQTENSTLETATDLNMLISDLQNVLSKFNLGDNFQKVKDIRIIN